MVEGAQKGMVWPEDIPDVVLAPAGPDAPEGDDAPVPVASKAPDDTPPRPTRRGHLKLVE